MIKKTTNKTPATHYFIDKENKVRTMEVQALNLRPKNLIEAH